MMDDLFDFEKAPEPRVARAPVIFSVTDLTRSVKEIIEETLGEVWVEGEVSNHRRQSSGHHYFILKDAGSQLQCVMFARSAAGVRGAALGDGMQVQCRGRMTVYEARGQYQLVVSEVRMAGAGLLQAQFEALKRKLENEGLFSADHKKELPRFPETVALITSPTGAALRDMLHVFARRAPWVRLIIVPVRVQGDGAAEEIAEAIEWINEPPDSVPRPDVIIAGRGGGSIEDLWAFNEEVVARAIFASEIPVVSAVGHETDFTISDFVADLRAPTPSAAAELVTAELADLPVFVEEMRRVMQRVMTQRLDQERSRLSLLTKAALFAEPLRRIDEWRQRLDGHVETLSHELTQWLQIARQRLLSSKQTLETTRPDQLILVARQRLELLQRSIQERGSVSLSDLRQKLHRHNDRLALLSPQATLERGYSMVRNARGQTVRTVKDVQTGEILETVFADGAIKVSVQ